MYYRGSLTIHYKNDFLFPNCTQCTNFLKTFQKNSHHKKSHRKKTPESFTSNHKTQFSYCTINTTIYYFKKLFFFTSFYIRRCTLYQKFIFAMTSLIWQVVSISSKITFDNFCQIWTTDVHNAVFCWKWLSLSWIFH